MNKLWKEKSIFKQFNPKKHHIHETCGFIKPFIPYERLYSTLNEEELLQLIVDAKTNHWQALDLTNCGLTNLPDELWDLPDLKMLYLGNISREDIQQKVKIYDNMNKFSSLPTKIEQLHNLQVLNLSNVYINVEKKSPLNLYNLVHLDIFRCNFQQIPTALLIPSLEEIGFNCLENTLSESFFNLKNLKRIYLTCSEISELSPQIGLLTKLHQLHLCGTKIESLPDSISKLKNLSRLLIFDTPLSSKIPPEILK